jgi:hypothetical protein
MIFGPDVYQPVLLIARIEYIVRAEALGALHHIRVPDDTVHSVNTVKTCSTLSQHRFVEQDIIPKNQFTGVSDMSEKEGRNAYET